MKLRMDLTILTLVAGLWLAPGVAHGQTARAGSDWQRVRALPPGTTIDVRSTAAHSHCKLTDVTDDSLACSSGNRTSSFQRTEVRSIKIARRGRSALIGGAIGAGALGIAGFAVTTGGGDGFFGSSFLRGETTGIALGVGAVVGGGVGALTGFSKSTVYKAP